MTDRIRCRSPIREWIMRGVAAVATCALLCGERGLADAPQAFRHQITGLFSADRAKDLAELIATLPDIKLLSVDFPQAEARFAYDPAIAFPGAKPEQLVERFDHLLRNASNHTFGAKPLSAVPPDRLKLVEIPVAGLDCKACCLAAYESIYRVEGVERATASFREGLVTAWIQPDKTGREALEEALRRKGVTVLPPKE